jgi:hypothetical protein
MPNQQKNGMERWLIPLRINQAQYDTNGRDVVETKAGLDVVHAYGGLEYCADGDTKPYGGSMLVGGRGFADGKRSARLWTMGLGVMLMKFDGVCSVTWIGRDANDDCG